MSIKCIIYVVLILCPSLISSRLSTVKQWNSLTFNFPAKWPVNNREFYNIENIVPTGIEFFEDRVFIAAPRIFSGIPATLSTVRLDSEESPVLNAYPNWDHHRAGLKRYNCSTVGLVSVYRIRIDSCNRLWVLDAGVSRTLEDYEITCPPKILVYDLQTDQVVRRIDFPANVLRGESLFTNLVIDETTSDPNNKCEDPFVYITDTVEPGIIVYDAKADLTWRLSHPTMYPNPDYSKNNVLGMEYTFMDGVIGLAFDAETGIVYFQPYATDRVFSVTKEDLRAGPLPYGKDLPVNTVVRKSSQGLALSSAPKGGTIFYGPVSETSIVAFNPRTNEQKTLAQDPATLQFTADMRMSKRDTSTLYALTTKFHRFFLKNINLNEPNIRIMRIEGALSEQQPVQNSFGLMNFGGLFTMLQPQPQFELGHSPFYGFQQPNRFEARFY